MGERGHGVEQVGEAAESGAKGKLCLVIGGIAVPCAYDHTRFDERGNIGGRDHLRRDGQHDLAFAGARQQLDHCRVDGADPVGFVDPAFDLVDERAFDMDADHAGNPCADRGVAGVERSGDLFGRIADERGQERGRAEARVRGTDCGDGLHADIVVEQHAAAAIDLRIDEAGQQPATFQIDRSRGSIIGVDRRHLALRQGKAGSVQDIGPDRDAAVGKASLHFVRVTLLRNGGLSGSNPRATESCAAKR